MTSLPAYINASHIKKTIALFIMLMTGLVNASDAQQPDKVIAETTATMLTALKKDRELINQSPRHVHVLANQIIMPHVDVQRMSSWVLGKHWRRATKEQKQLFPAQFRNLILRTYATALSEYTDETINYLPLHTNGNEVSVKTIIERRSGPNIPVAYRMHKTQGEWKVYDISIDGISLLSNYRRSFSSEIRRHGINGLINKLMAKNNTVIKEESKIASN